MSFNPQGVSFPQMFKKQQSGNSNFRQTPTDKLVEVVSITGGENGQGSMVVLERNERFGVRRCHVKISHKTQERMKNSSGYKNTSSRGWSGNVIDSHMEQEIPVGSVLVLEACLSTGPKKVVNGEETYFFETNWVHKVSDPSPEKTFSGIFTISTYKENVVAVQHWREKALPIDLSGENADNSQLEALADDLDVIVKAKNDGDFLPNIGVQFYTAVPSKTGADGKVEEYTTIDTSPPFDWVPGKTDENGVKIEGHPLTGDRFIELIGGYRNYIFGDAESGIKPKFSNEELKDAILEVQVYTNITASQKSQSMIVSEERKGAPLYRMSHTPTKYAQDDQGYVTTKNWAVFGILTISSDKAEVNMKTRQTVFTRRDLATRLFANGVMGNVLSFVRTSDGTKKVPHENLKVILNPTGAQEEGQGASQQPNRTQTTVQSQSPSSVNTVRSPQPQAEPEMDLSLSSNTEDDPFADDPFADFDTVDNSVQSSDNSDDVPFEVEEEEKKDTDEGQAKRSIGGGRRRDI